MEFTPVDMKQYYTNEDLIKVIKDPASVQIQTRTIDGANWICKVYYEDNHRHTQILERA